VRALDGKLYVLRDLSGRQEILAGNEIRAINGVAAGKIVQTMLAATPGDGDVQTSRLRRIGGANFDRELINLLGLESPYTITLWDDKRGLERTVRLDGIEASKLREPRPRDSATLTFLDDGKIADLKINQFGGTANKKDLRVFFQECFSEIDKKKSAALILDLRDNGGGADELGKQLLSFLIDEPFQYYDDLVLNGLDSSLSKYSAKDLEVEWKRALSTGMLERQANGKYRNVKHPNWGIQQPSKPTFTGKVYILINGNSFSTTSEFLSHAHARKRATFIGEESGGGYSGNTSGPGALLTLPNTKLQVYVPLMAYYMAVRDYKSASHGVVPEYQIKYTIDELLEGKNKELEVALELARKR
jgi:C-terminal processing protease CtpA/Prc